MAQKIHFFPVILIMSYIGLFSVDARAQNEYNGEILFTIVEKMPQFPGGPAELEKFFRKNIRYPKKAHIEGIVYVQFYVTKTGEAVNPHIKRGLGDEIDQEVIQAIKKMPKWIPGSQNGKNVHVIFNLPVKLKSR